MHESTPAIRTVGLTRRFGSITAVDCLDLALPRGTVFGFLGPNGAGKSTTIHMLAGLLPPSGGEAWVAGIAVRGAGPDLKRRIGMVPERSALYDRLTVLEHLQLVGRLHGLGPAELDRRISPLLDVLGLTGSVDRMVEDYSAGMRKKTALACALIHAPEVLFLDEPFESVDPVATRAIKGVLRDMAAQRGVTIFFSTHVLDLAERFCDRVGIIHRGRLIAEGTVAGLRAGAGLAEDAPLEEVFLHAVQAGQGQVDGLLSWLTGPQDPSHGL